MDEYKRSNVVKNYLNFLKKIEELKLYIIEFNKDGMIKPKVYSPDCAVKSENHQLIILIPHDNCTFSANDSI